MALPINIHDLIHGSTVEWERLEFKGGWNPEDVLHTICAFANDINNWGGGYVVIGIEEKNGRPILPPKGLPLDQIDALQKKMQELCHTIDPYYFPVLEPVLLQDQHILVIWVPGGDNRPYKAPIRLGEKGTKAYFVRRGSITKRANHTEEKQLYELAAKIPFDDRVHHQASLKDLSLSLIQAFLKEVGSGLYEASTSMDFAELCQKMRIVTPLPEYTKPLNIGLLLFHPHPEHFFRGAKIEVIIYQDETGDRFSEKIFLGPLHHQLREALQYIKTQVIREEVRKVKGQAEALRFFNYPYEAVEEVLANAIYHRSYEHQSPIEVNVRPQAIEVLSFPGPLPPITSQTLKHERIIARDYRNRRIGDFLKELHLTEGRGTGLPKIYRTMEGNGSPKPVFETDEARTYFLVTLPIHSKAQVEAQGKAQVHIDKVNRSEIQAAAESLTEIEQQILKLCQKVPLSTREVASRLGHKSISGNLKKAFPRLIQLGLLQYTIPDKPRSSKQKYKTTDVGQTVLKALKV